MSKKLTKIITRVLKTSKIAELPLDKLKRLILDVNEIDRLLEYDRADHAANKEAIDGVKEEITDRIMIILAPSLNTGAVSESSSLNIEDIHFLVRWVWAKNQEKFNAWVGADKALIIDKAIPDGLSASQQAKIKDSNENVCAALIMLACARQKLAKATNFQQFFTAQAEITAYQQHLAKVKKQHTLTWFQKTSGKKNGFNNAHQAVLALDFAKQDDFLQRKAQTFVFSANWDQSNLFSTSPIQTKGRPKTVSDELSGVFALINTSLMSLKDPADIKASLDGLEVFESYQKKLAEIEKKCQLTFLERWFGGRQLKQNLVAIQAQIKEAKRFLPEFNEKIVRICGVKLSNNNEFLAVEDLSLTEERKKILEQVFQKSTDAQWSQVRQAFAKKNGIKTEETAQFAKWVRKVLANPAEFDGSSNSAALVALTQDLTIEALCTALGDQLKTVIDAVLALIKTNQLLHPDNGLFKFVKKLIEVYSQSEDADQDVKDEIKNSHWIAIYSLWDSMHYDDMTPEVKDKILPYLPEFPQEDGPIKNALETLLREQIRQACRVDRGLDCCREIVANLPTSSAQLQNDLNFAITHKDAIQSAVDELKKYIADPCDNDPQKLVAIEAIKLILNYCTKAEKEALYTLATNASLNLQYQNNDGLKIIKNLLDPRYARTADALAAYGRFISEVRGKKAEQERQQRIAEEKRVTELKKSRDEAAQRIERELTLAEIKAETTINLDNCVSFFRDTPEHCSDLKDNLRAYLKSTLAEVCPPIFARLNNLDLQKVDQKDITFLRSAHEKLEQFVETVDESEKYRNEATTALSTLNCLTATNSDTKSTASFDTDSLDSMQEHTAQSIRRMIIAIKIYGTVSQNEQLNAWAESFHESAQRRSATIRKGLGAFYLAPVLTVAKDTVIDLIEAKKAERAKAQADEAIRIKAEQDRLSVIRDKCYSIVKDISFDGLAQLKEQISLLNAEEKKIMTAIFLEKFSVDIKDKAARLKTLDLALVSAEEMSQLQAFYEVHALLSDETKADLQKKVEKDFLELASSSVEPLLNLSTDETVSTDIRRLILEIKLYGNEADRVKLNEWVKTFYQNIPSKIDKRTKAVIRGLGVFYPIESYGYTLDEINLRLRLKTITLSGCDDSLKTQILTSSKKTEMGKILTEKVKEKKDGLWDQLTSLHLRNVPQDDIKPLQIFFATIAESDDAQKTVMNDKVTESYKTLASIKQKLETEADQSTADEESSSSDLGDDMVDSNLDLSPVSPKDEECAVEVRKAMIRIKLYGSLDDAEFLDKWVQQFQQFLSDKPSAKAVQRGLGVFYPAPVPVSAESPTTGRIIDRLFAVGGAAVSPPKEVVVEKHSAGVSTEKKMKKLRDQRGKKSATAAGKVKNFFKMG